MRWPLSAAWFSAAVERLDWIIGRPFNFIRLECRLAETIWSAGRAFAFPLRVAISNIHRRLRSAAKPCERAGERWRRLTGGWLV